MKKFALIAAALVAGFVSMACNTGAGRRQDIERGWRGHPEGSEIMKPFTARRPGRAARPRQRRHRRDHPRAVPEVDQAQRLRSQRLRRVALPRRRPARPGQQHASAQPRLRAQPGALPGRADPAHPRQLRLRQLARARAVGARGLWLSRADRAPASPTSSSTTASRTACCRSSSTPPRSTSCSASARRARATAWSSILPAQTIIRPDGKSIAFDIDPFRRNAC